MDQITLSERAKTTIGLGESHFREFKSGEDGPPGYKTLRKAKAVCVDVARTLVAFANADGGELLVGVEDNCQITGLNEFSETELDLIEKAPHTHVHADTPLQNLSVARLELDGKLVIYFSIAKSNSYVHHTADGRCIQRRDLESVPISAQQINIERREVLSQEYDREFVDGAQVSDLNLNLVKIVSDQISSGMSAEKCLQYLNLLEYDRMGVRLRRAALLLFAKVPEKWHPRLQLRVMKVEGVELQSGSEYNVSADEVVTGNIIDLLENGWDALRPFLVQPVFGRNAKFGQRVMYPEHACTEALVNAIAHRDYSQEGQGIEIYIYQDRMEVRSPGSLLSVIRVEDLIEQKGVHHSRNGLIARVLRELGYMRELGEGIRRIFELMKRNELAAPNLTNTSSTFSVELFHRPSYSMRERLWLDQFSDFDLTREEKVIVLLGQGAQLIAPQDIWDALGIVDTEHYRQVVFSLQEKGILDSQLNKNKAQNIARKKRISVRKIPRFAIRLPSSISPVQELSSSDSCRSESSSRRLWVGNLPFDLDENDLIGLLQEYGAVEYFSAPKSSGDKGKGFAFVEFGTDQAAEQLLNDSRKISLRDRSLIVQWATPRA